MAGIIKATQAEHDEAARASAVLKLNDLAQEARTIVLEARQQAAQILADATRKADQTAGAARAQARRDGLEEARRQVREEIEQHGRQSLQEAAGQLRQLGEVFTSRLEETRQELQRQARRELLTFAVELAEKIVGRVAEKDIAAAKRNLAKVLEMIGTRGEVTLRVNPDQFELLREHAGQLMAEMEIRGQVNIAPDAEISPGGVKLLSRDGEIDATVETQFSALSGALLDRPHGAGRYEPTANQANRTERQHESV